MGILNVTPDSFSDGGKHAAPGAALEQARRMISDGAEIIDIGGESTRPGAEPVTAEEEMRRTVPVIAALREEWAGGISIDTSKPEVARAALAAGADVVNDVTGLRDPEMREICAERKCAVVVMHMRGEPRTMQMAPIYGDVVAEVRGYFRERFAELAAAGISDHAICFDPGIGFGKSLEHNLALLGALESLAPENRPLLLGVSRKSFLGAVTPGTADCRDTATAVVTALVRRKNVMLHRVHDVRKNLAALRLAEAILS